MLIYVWILLIDSKNCEIMMSFHNIKAMIHLEFRSGASL